MKQCVMCEIKKDLDEFYTNKQMADGKLSACKVCVKVRVKARTDARMLIPELKEQEQARGREKYHSLFNLTRILHDNL